MKPKPKGSEKLSKNGSKMYENWSKNGSKLPLGGFLGSLGGPLGALWVSRGAPRLEKSEKVRSWTPRPPGGPIGSPLLLIFHEFMLFGSCFLGIFVFDPFGDSILTVLGIIFECFLIKESDSLSPNL